MKNFFKKHKIALTIIIFLLIVPAPTYYGATFVLEQINQKNVKYQESLVDKNLEKLKLQKIPKMEEINNEFEESSYVVGAIMDSNKEVEFIRYIEKLAEETDNKISIKILEVNREELAKQAKAKTAAQQKAEKKVELDDEKNEAKNKKKIEKTIEEQLAYDKYTPIQLDLEGKYVSLLSFVNKLENSDYYANIISFSLGREVVTEKTTREEISPVAKDIFISIPAENEPVAAKKEESILKSTMKVIVYNE